MRTRGKADPIEAFRETMVGLVRSDDPDLTARQLSVFLVCYTTGGPHTVRGLAKRLQVQKPAVVRAIDRLERFDLARRRPDLQDRRSVFVDPTETGQHLLRQIRLSLAHNVEGQRGKPESQLKAVG